MKLLNGVYKDHAHGEFDLFLPKNSTLATDTYLLLNFF